MRASDVASDPPAGLFTLVGAQALTETPPQPHVVWLGEVRGRVYGLITSPIGYIMSVGADDIRRHAFVSAIQRCFLSEEFVSLMDVEPVDLDKIFYELGTSEFGNAAVDVGGTTVPCCAVVYRGVKFVGGFDQSLWPFTLARRAVERGAWPQLAVTMTTGG
jgi:hypothetical protein